MELTVGVRIGNLVLVEKTHKVTTRKRPAWRCLCDCGNSIVVLSQSLSAMSAKCCGCERRRKTAQAQITHGMSRTKEWHAWCNMRARCADPNHQSYHNYGGRGIRVCQSWMESFDNFFSDMGIAPPGTTIDRIDNDGDYSPTNCRWTSRKEQARNTRRNRIVQARGKSQCVAAWAEELSVPYDAVRDRLDRGMNPEEVIESLA